MNTAEKAIIGLIALGAGGLAVFYILKSKPAVAQSTPTTTPQKPTGIDVSNLSVCDPTIKNGDYAIVPYQAFTGLSGTFIIKMAAYMQNDAQYGNFGQGPSECNETVSEFIASHYGFNNTMWTTP